MLAQIAVAHVFGLRPRVMLRPAVFALCVVACAPARITSFQATPPRVPVGGTSELSFTTQGATKCRLEPLGSDVGSAGTVAVTPAETTEYTLTCGTTKATTRVEVKTELGVFTAAPTRVFAGDVVTLTWASDAPGCRLEPLARDVMASGSTTVRPLTTTTYTVKCADAQQTVTVTVDAPPDDPFFASQWHLANTGQRGGVAGEDIRAVKAWESARGEGVRVVVVDDGADVMHEDLVVNAVVADSHDYLAGAAGDVPQHGTAVSGIIAARDVNGVGGRGVAPRASFAVYNLLQDSTSQNELDSMVRGLDRNGVSNNSWGDADDGTGQLTFPETLWLRGVERGTREGRGGKGLIYLFPSGNGGDGQYEDDGNYDGQANSRFVLAIGGVSDDGRKTGYSEGGANVLVVTPAGERGNNRIVTTDVTGPRGYSSGRTPGEPANANYTSTFDGTSAATPVAAGVAALVLQVNPNLTWRDMRRVFALSTRQNDVTDRDWLRNGAGYLVNHKYGFGLLDASKAVELAKTYVAGAAEATHTTALQTVNLDVPDNDQRGVSASVDLQNTGVRQVDFVEVTVTATHPVSGDLDIVLRHGQSTSVLHPTHSCSPCSDIDGFTFTSVRHLDEAGDGTWTLEVRDRGPQDVGRWVSWKLALYGRP